MAITEDYVNFETAKLLKKKGFDEKCNSYFISNNEIALIANKRDFNKHGIYLSAPTLQRAVKWLMDNIQDYTDDGMGEHSFVLVQDLKEHFKNYMKEE